MLAIFHVSPEHEARELLNLILLLERCLALPDATDAERATWHADLADTRNRLDGLLAPGRESALMTRRLAAHAGETVRARGGCV